MFRNVLHRSLKGSRRLSCFPSSRFDLLCCLFSHSQSKPTKQTTANPNSSFYFDVTVDVSVRLKDLSSEMRFFVIHLRSRESHKVGNRPGNLLRTQSTQQIVDNEIM